jgi:lipid-A-disaccharide synthase
MDNESPRATTTATQPLIVLVAGEQSGDNLAAQLIDALRTRLPNARFAGIAGPKMIAAGCEPWTRAEELAVMGLFEVLPELPRLLRIRRQLIERIKRERPVVYIGVDFKEFNLSVARQLKEAGIRTVQYVSPQIWAWRQGRVRKIARAVDLMLCLLPFEKPFYDAHNVDARFVGHPLADRIPMSLDRSAARSELALDANRPCVALLPGSRRGEVSRLAPDFARTVAWLIERQPAFQFVAAMANAQARNIFAAALGEAGVASAVKLIDGQSQTAMVASDVVLLASGTATLEATLCKRPMVVVYRLGWLTSLLLRQFKLMKAPFFSQPNLLAGKQWVPEYFNESVRAGILGPAVMEQLHRPDDAALLAAFTEIHEVLRRNASQQAAAAVAELILR